MIYLIRSCQRELQITHIGMVSLEVNHAQSADFNIHWYLISTIISKEQSLTQRIYLICKCEMEKCKQMKEWSVEDWQSTITRTVKVDDISPSVPVAGILLGTSEDVKRWQVSSPPATPVVSPNPPPGTWTPTFQYWNSYSHQLTVTQSGESDCFVRVMGTATQLFVSFCSKNRSFGSVIETM
jgi:hypothetical protein